MKRHTTKNQPHVIDFKKELAIQEITRLLRTWPSDRVLFLRHGLERPPQVVRSTCGKYRERS